MQQAVNVEDWGVYLCMTPIQPGYLTNSYTTVSIAFQVLTFGKQHNWYQQSPVHQCSTTSINNLLSG